MQAVLGQNAKLQVLNKREVENYLIHPRAIRSFIECKKYLTGISSEEMPTEEEIKKKIDECAEELKQFAINKRVVKISCKPVYPNTKEVFETSGDQDSVSKIVDSIESMIRQLEIEKDNLEAVYKSKVDELDNVWQAKKLDIVPGDILLDEVCKEYGLRFKKEKDTAKLANLMQKDEIDPEIKRVIQEIVA